MFWIILTLTQVLTASIHWADLASSFSQVTRHWGFLFVKVHGTKYFSDIISTIFMSCLDSLYLENHFYLQLLQNAAARLLTGTRKRDHISSILAFLKWLPVKYRINFKTLLFVFKALNGLVHTHVSSKEIFMQDAQSTENNLHYMNEQCDITVRYKIIWFTKILDFSTSEKSAFCPFSLHELADTLVSLLSRRDGYGRGL